MSSTVITDDQFQHIAKLSRLEIKPEESFIKDQLSQAAEYVEVLKELNTDGVEPTYQVNHKKNVTRPDVVTDSLPQDLALSQAKETLNGYFKTAPTINKNK
jgi:aspartyl-tRNA(Asn)/glutamyl-tRNA(Gln) amidotransferase subunit C